jgi:hypothetical protein
MASILKLIMLLCALLIIPCRPEAASFLSDVWGVVTDPLKLGKASQELSNAIERTLAGLRDLEQTANQDVKARIDQLRTITTEVIAAVDRNALNLRDIVDGSLRKVQDIEEKTYRDAIELIYRGQCTAEVFTSDQLQRSLAQVIENIIQANPGVTFLGIRVAGVNLKSVTITDPDKAYISAKRYYLERLKILKDNDPASHDAIILISDRACCSWKSKRISKSGHFPGCERCGRHCKISKRRNENACNCCWYPQCCHFVRSDSGRPTEVRQCS